MTADDRYPELFQFAGYFNEDWMEDAPTWQGLIDFYVEHTSTELRRRVLFELNQLLLDCRTDSEVDTAVREIGFMYWPPPQTYREWLIDVRDRLATKL